MRTGFLILTILMLLTVILPRPSYARGLQEMYMTKENLQDAFQRNMEEYSGAERSRLQQEYEHFLHFLPRAQQILLVRDQLVPILEAFVRERPSEAGYAGKMLDLVKTSFPENKQSGDTGYLFVFFEYSQDGFQVDNIAPDRLAINTGYDIRFNTVGLMQKEKLSMGDIVQLWLHEISHFDDKTSLEVRDKFSSSVAQWAQEHTTEISVSANKKIISLILPAKQTLPESLEAQRTKRQYRTSPEQLHIHQITESFLALEQDRDGTRIYDDAYKGFLTFGNFIKMGAENWDHLAFSTLNVNWQKVQVRSVKPLPNKKIQIEYIQNSYLYGRDAIDQQKYNRGSIYGEGAIMPSFPENTYRVELEPEGSDFEIKRSYSRPLEEGDFEVYRVEDVRSGRYLSLRLKLTDAATKIKNSGSLHLIGKDLKNAELLSFALNKMRFLNKDEVLLHIKVPNRNFELSQIRLPEVDKNGRYSERNLLPSRPVSLLASNVLESAKQEKSQIQSLDIEEKQFAEDHVHARVSLKTNKKVVGVTLDLEHTLLSYQNNYPAQPNQIKDLTYIGEGRKYYIKAQDLQMKNSILSFAIPEADITQRINGPILERKISVFYTERIQSSALTLRDTQNRSIQSLWIHFADGSVEKMPIEKRKGFSLIFDSDRVIIHKCDDLFNENTHTTDYADTFG